MLFAHTEKDIKLQRSRIHSQSET